MDNFSATSPVLGDPLRLFPAQPRLRDVPEHVIPPGKPGPASARTEVLFSFVVHVYEMGVLAPRSALFLSQMSLGPSMAES